jgi:hypothetical protein
VFTITDFPARRINPQALQLVVVPLIPGKDVNDEVIEIDKDPPGLGPTLDMIGPDSQRIHPLLQISGDGTQLRFRFTCADHEIVREGCQALQIQDYDIIGFLILNGLNGGLDFSGQFYGPYLL